MYDRDQLETSLSQMEAAASIFAQRFIKDGKARHNYIQQTRTLSQEYRTLVTTGSISAKEAAGQVQTIRNEILEAQRLRSSDIGRAKAISLKTNGLALNDLTAKYANNKFGTEFSNLSTSQKNLVYLEIIDSSGRARPSVTLSAKRYTTLGRGLIIVTIGFAVYNIVAAEDKIKATAREGVVIGGGICWWSRWRSTCWFSLWPGFSSLCYRWCFYWRGSRCSWC